MVKYPHSLTLRLPAALDADLERLAELERNPISSLVRRLLANGVERERDRDSSGSGIECRSLGLGDRDPSLDPDASLEGDAEARSTEGHRPAATARQGRDPGHHRRKGNHGIHQRRTTLGIFCHSHSGSFHLS